MTKQKLLCILLSLSLALTFSACDKDKKEKKGKNEEVQVTQAATELPATPVPAKATAAPTATPAPEESAEPVTAEILYEDKPAETLEFMTSTVFQLKARLSDGSGGGAWTSSDAGVASVDENGIVTCWKAGTVKITYTSGAASASCSLNVKEATVKILYGGVEKDDISLSSVWGYDIQLTAYVTPEGSDVVWSAEDPSIVSVSENGLVTSLHQGNTTVYCKCGTAKAACIIRVLGIPPKQAADMASATPDPSDTTPRVIITYAGAENHDFTIAVGTSVDMNYMLRNIPENSAVTWSVDDTSIATVNQDGVVTGIRRGTAKLICTCGDVKDECIARITDTH